MTSSLLLLGRRCLCQPPLNSGHPSFRRNRPREGGRPAQGHTGVWTRAAGVPHIPLGPGAPNPQAGRLQRPRGPRPRRESDLLPPPITQSEGGAVRAQRSAPLRQCLAGPQPLVPGPQPQEFNPFPADGRVRAPHSQPARTQRRGRGDPKRGKIPHIPPPRAGRPCAPEGRARRWADKRGDRQGLAYHGAVALGAHRAPRDRAAPGGQAGAAP